MWETFKNKIKNLFTYEVEEVIEESVEIKHEPIHPIMKPESPEKPSHVSKTQSKSNTNRNAQGVRMTYQYPKERNFRFPLNVETPEQHQLHEKRQPRRQNERIYSVNRPEEPAVEFKRSRSNLETQQKKSAITGNQPAVERTGSHSLSNEQEKKRPFQPTQVPSPIYGYHPRHKEGSEHREKPAFLRRKEEKERIEIKQEAASAKQEASIAQREFLRSGKAEAPQTIESDHIVKEPVQKRNPIHSTAKEVREETVSRTLSQERDEMKVQSAQEEIRAESQQTTGTPVTKKDEQAIVNEQQGAVPYNVIMTDTDKLLLARKQHMQKKVRNEQVVTQPQESAVDHFHQHNHQEETVRNQLEDMPIHLLNDPEPENHEDDLWVIQQQELLEQTLQHFNVKAKVVNATQGPSVTRFEVQPELGVKVSKVKNLSDDLKLNMAAKDIRIEAPIPGKNTIGIEVPNQHAQTVGLQEILESKQFKESPSPLTIGLGLSIEGTPIVTNIQKMPHGLIAGATGSGKSVCINTILLSLLYKASHEDVRFLLIDPKMVELAPYNGIPHLVSPVITDVKAATAALKWAVAEMEDRYECFVKEGVRDISRYNQKMVSQGRTDEKMPFLVIIIDELADLMMVSPQDVEDAICRIAQKARACGIHLLLATQRPSVDVITGLIKANIPTRIAFSVSSQVDSRTIIDTSGAERLLGRGDMLFVENGAGKSIRIQGAFVSDEEIERVTQHARSIAPANYLFEQEELLAKVQVDEEADELLEEVIEFVIEQNHASTSMLQRHFRIGYNRAARLIDTLEARGIINQQNGSKPRDVLVSKAQLEEMLK